jgi:hypothetical protein
MTIMRSWVSKRSNHADVAASRGAFHDVAATKGANKEPSVTAAPGVATFACKLPISSSLFRAFRAIPQRHEAGQPPHSLLVCAPFNAVSGRPCRDGDEHQVQNTNKNL